MHLDPDMQCCNAPISPARMVAQFPHSLCDGAGDNKSSAVHVDDLARAYVALLSHPTAQGIFNIVGENGITGKTVADIIANKLQCKAGSITAAEASRQLGVVAKFTTINCQGDGSMARRELDWQPEYTNFKETV